MVYGTTPVLPLIDLALPIITSRCPGYYGICTSPLSPAICLVSGVLECPCIGDQRPIRDAPVTTVFVLRPFCSLGLVRNTLVYYLHDLGSGDGHAPCVPVGLANAGFCANI